ncbi:MAG: family 10 glycosylhydrolase [FCB group bacterium]|nr:family 10 glycosylhydrolase [FCB group bacterium]
MQTGTTLAGNPRFQYRYLWVVRNTLTSKAKIDQMLFISQEAGITDILVQVRGRGDALYESLLVPTSPLLKNATFDPLAYVLQEAHRRSIRVHAWVNVYVVWSPNQQTAPLGHLIYEHPEWFDQDYSRQDLPENGRQITGDPDEGYYLSPNHPAVSPYLLSVFRELAARYPIDGLHLDYVRYKGAPYGYNPDALAQYKLNTGKDPRKVVLNFRKMPDNPVYRSEKNKWDDSRRKAVTQLVSSIHDMLQEVRPQCALSVAVKPDLIQAREKFYQEWDVWLAAGYVDWVIPMNYSSNLHEYARVIDVIYDNLPEKYRKRIIMGLALYNQKAPEAGDKIKYTLITRFPGISLFSYNTLQEHPFYLRDLGLNP